MACISGVQLFTPSDAFGSAPRASICRTAATSPSRTAPTKEPITPRRMNEITCRMRTICVRNAIESSACRYKVKPAPELEIDQHALPLAFAKPAHDLGARNNVHRDLLPADAAAFAAA